MFTRKEYATSVSGKAANGCPVRSAEPPDNMDFNFISPSADGETLCINDSKAAQLPRIRMIYEVEIRRRRYYGFQSNWTDQ